MKNTIKLLSFLVVLSMTINANAPALSQVDQEKRVAESPSPANLQAAGVENEVGGASSEPSAEDAVLVKGGVKKKKSFLGGIGSFLADVLFGGEYLDGYTSFLSG